MPHTPLGADEIRRPNVGDRVRTVGKQDGAVRTLRAFYKIVPAPVPGGFAAVCCAPDDPGFVLAETNVTHALCRTEVHWPRNLIWEAPAMSLHAQAVRGAYAEAASGGYDPGTSLEPDAYPGIFGTGTSAHRLLAIRAVDSDLRRRQAQTWYRKAKALASAWQALETEAAAPLQLRFRPIATRSALAIG